MSDCNTVNNSVAKSHREMESHLLSLSCSFIRLEIKKKKPKTKPNKKKPGNETVSTLHPKKSRDTTRNK